MDFVRRDGQPFVPLGLVPDGGHPQNPAVRTQADARQKGGTRGQHRFGRVVDDAWLCRHLQTLIHKAGGDSIPFTRTLTV